MRFLTIWIMLGHAARRRFTDGFNQTLTSWTTHAYSVQIMDRYTRRAELVLKDMLHGNEAVMHINARLNEMIRDRRLGG